MTDDAKKAIAALTVLYFMGRPHSPICDCPSCRAWDVCNEQIPASVFIELDAISGRKPNPMVEHGA